MKWFQKLATRFGIWVVTRPEEHAYSILIRAMVAIMLLWAANILEGSLVKPMLASAITIAIITMVEGFLAALAAKHVRRHRLHIPLALRNQDFIAADFNTFMNQNVEYIHGDTLTTLDGKKKWIYLDMPYGTGWHMADDPPPFKPWTYSKVVSVLAVKKVAST